MRLLVIALIVLFPAAAFGSPISVGGINFPAGEAAFADTAFLVSGSGVRFTCTAGGTAASSYAEALSGSDVTQCVNVVGGGNGIVEVQFTDNAVQNGSGTDLVIFEVSGPKPPGTPDPAERFEVSIFNGTAFSALVSFDPVATGFGTPDPTLDVFAVQIDLSSFGIAPGASVDRVRLHLFDNHLGSKGADIAALGAVNSVPVICVDADCVINNGLEPPNPENVIDDGTYSEDSVYVRNMGCPPGWPSGGAGDLCPAPGAQTAVEIVDGGTVNNLLARDSSTITMTGGTGSEELTAHDSSTITIVGSNFEVDGALVPYGDLTAQTGTLTGILASGDPISNVFYQGGGDYTGTITLVQEPPQIEVYNTDVSPAVGFVKVLEEGDVLSRAEVGSCPGFHTVTTGERDNSSPESLDGEFTHPGGVEHYNEGNQPYCWPMDQSWYDMAAGIPNCSCRDNLTSVDGDYSITVTPYDGELVGGEPTGTPGLATTINFSIATLPLAVTRIEVYNTDLPLGEQFVKVLEEGDLLDRAEIGSCPAFHTVTNGSRHNLFPESLEGDFTYPSGTDAWNETGQPYCWPLDSGWYDIAAGVPICGCRAALTAEDGAYSITVTPFSGELVAGEPTGIPGQGLTINFSIFEATCGNGTIEVTEACDDGNTAPSDGCDASCQIEPGWVCAGEPSVCGVCGDGVILGLEQCDDGGTTSGDGCDASCQIEAGWTCEGEPSACTQTRAGGGTDLIYFAQSSQAIRAIRTGEVASGNVQTLQDVSPEQPAGVTIDVANEVVYWAETSPNDTGPERVRRRSLAPATPEDITPPGIDGPRGLVLDPIGKRLYLADFQTGAVIRMKLDGSDPETILTLSAPTELALDLKRRQIYFVHQGGTRIGRSRLDGGAPDLSLITIADDRIDALAVHSNDDSLYFGLRGCVCSTSATGSVRRASVYEPGVSEDFSGPLSASPLHLQVDPIDGYVYWSFFDSIQRKAIDGAGPIETVVDGLQGFSGLSGVNFFALDFALPRATPALGPVGLGGVVGALATLGVILLHVYRRSGT